MQLYNKNMHTNDKYCTFKNHSIYSFHMVQIVGFKSFSILIMTNVIYLNQFSVPLPWARTCTRVKSCSLTSSRLCFCRALWITWAVLSWLVNCTRDHKKTYKPVEKEQNSFQFLLNIHRTLWEIKELQSSTIFSSWYPAEEDINVNSKNRIWMMWISAQTTFRSLLNS